MEPFHWRHINFTCFPRKHRPCLSHTVLISRVESALKESSDWFCVCDENRETDFHQAAPSQLRLSARCTDGNPQGKKEQTATTESGFPWQRHHRQWSRCPEQTRAQAQQQKKPKQVIQGSGDRKILHFSKHIKQAPSARVARLALTFTLVLCTEAAASFVFDRQGSKVAGTRLMLQAAV